MPWRPAQAGLAALAPLAVASTLALLAGCSSGGAATTATTATTPATSPTATSSSAASANGGEVLSVLFPASQFQAAQAYAVSILRYPSFYQAPNAVTAEQGQAVQQWMAGHDPAGSQLGKLRIPVLVADGTQDALNPVANDHQLAGEVPGARLVLYPGAGHAFLFQDSASFLPAVQQFLS